MLKVGDGTVILKQQADANNKVQAFAQVGIVSGRSTVVLTDDKQVKPDSIYFGFRGGRLDLNGNSLTFEHIRNIDEGARVVNHNTTKESTVTITGDNLVQNLNEIQVYYPPAQEDDYYNLRLPLNAPRGKNLYYSNACNSYYTLKKSSSLRSLMPCNGNESNEDWIYMGKNSDEAKRNVMKHINNERMNGFNGYFGEDDGKGTNGELNITFSGKTDQNRFLLTGGTNLNGELKVEKGTLFLSGRPTPHARDIANISSTNKDPHFAENNEVVVEDDWINRNFKATTMNVTGNASLYSGRNVANITSNITASSKAQVHIGYKAGDTVCVRSDYTGYVTCTNDPLSEKALHSFKPTNIHGNVNLTESANFTLGKANLFGTIHSTETSQVNLKENSHWHLTGDSSVNQLNLDKGHIHLNNVSDTTKATKYHTLNISNLSGNGSFYYWVDFTNNKSDKVVVTKSATGNFTLQVANKTGEPNHNELTLFDASTVAERSNLKVTLANGKVDRGAWSYTLKENNGRYYLHNPEAEKRNLAIGTPSIATPNDMQADAPSVPNYSEEITRVEAPAPPAPPPAPATTTDAAPKNQNGFNRTGTGYSIVADTKETVMITHKYDNGEIFKEKVVFKSEFTEDIDKYKENRPDLTATGMKSTGTNSYAITYKTVTAEEAPKEPLKMDNPHTLSIENKKPVAVVKPEETPNGVTSHKHSETDPKSDTATQADNPNSESVPSETIEKVAENSPQESETVAKNEQEAAETTPQNDEVAKAQSSAETKAKTNEVAQSGSEAEETQEAETTREPEINSTEETAVENYPTSSEPKSRRRRNVSSSSNNINPTATEDTTKVEKEETQEAPQVASQVSPKQEQSEDAKPQAEPARENVSTVNTKEPQSQESATASTEQPEQESSTNTGSANAMTETAEKSDKPQTETVTENDRQPEANTVADNSVANNLTSVKPTENSSTEAEQPVTESTTVSTENAVVENPENTTPATTQSAVSSEAVQSETATTEAVISQAKVTSAEETTVASTQETTVDNSVSTPQPRSRRTRRSAQNSYEPVELPTKNAENAENAQSGNNVVNSQSALRDLTSTNTNAVLSNAMAKAQFVALNVGKAVSQHISQLEMNNEGQYNVWVSNTSMNENYSSSQYRRFSSKSAQTQLGWDQTISSNVQLGGVFTYVRNSNNFDKASSKNTLAQANLYSKYYVDNHWYLAVDLGYGNFQSNFQSNLQTNHNAKFARHTAQIGLTAGKAFNLGNFAVKPTVGVRYSYLSNANFALAQDRIKVNPISVKTAFAQVDLSYTYHLGEFSITPILSARYDANQGSGKINVDRYDFAYNVENQQQYNAGLKLKYHNVKLSLIGGLTKAKQAEKQKTAELKLSFSF